ncbi:MAG: helix-turn-helix domain-containing protein [Bacteroidales bacterium]|nr:helix-turn-helix domain-containing protein [Bacteroidales bacterium]
MRTFLILTGCLLWFLPAIVKAQTDVYEKELQRLEQLEGNEFRVRVDSLYHSLDQNSPYQSKVVLIDRLFQLTAKKDEIAHIRVLVYKALLATPQQSRLFKQAYTLAKKHNRTDDMCFVEYSRGMYYIARKQYDSAMIHILSYRDMTPADQKDEGYRNIINLLGDIYYHAKLYDQAREIYFDLYQQYKQEDSWNFYRPYVMMNNLGQIALLTGKTDEASQWFNQSLVTADQFLHTPYRNNTLAYTKIKLAETALKSDSLERATRWLDQVASYPEETIFEDVLQEYLFTKSLLLLQQGEPDEALVIALQLLPGDSLQFSQYRFLPDIYRLLSDISSSRGDYPLALQYNKQYNLMADSMKELEHVAQSMIILADRNHELTRLDLQQSKQRIRYLMIGLSSLLIILLVVIFLYRKLYKSKLDLVRKSLEKNTIITQMPARLTDGDATVTTHHEEDPQQKHLIEELNRLMEIKKTYLNPHITIRDVAVLLSTNRTYLSQAINRILQTTFPNYINEFRIREAVRMITEGYTRQHTQEALSRECGFANRTVFIAVFKKHTGVTPSFFAANYGSAMDNE